MLDGVFQTRFPRFVRIAQHPDAPKVDDIPAAIQAELGRIDLASSVRPGMSIAVTAGSRGVANIPVILRAVVSVLRRLGADPFIIPAMGSHGGATPEGQEAVLRKLGITEESTGASIRSSLDTVQIAVSPSGIPVWVDRHAAEADGVVVVARIKPHTDFEGDIESGLFKMMVIGLGKHRGAILAHRQFASHGYSKMIREIGTTVLNKLPVLAGIGTIENAYGETAAVVAARTSDFEEVERAYLRKAKSLVGRLPFDDLDVLIVDEMGKDIAGPGMDLKVIGRVPGALATRPPKPRIKRVVVRDLTRDTGGNAMGIGAADYTTRRLYDKIDFHTTYVNAITGNVPELGRVPIVCESDREALASALCTIGEVDEGDARVVRIKNTRELGQMLISEALIAEARAKEFIEILGGPQEMVFDVDGNLLPIDW